MNLNYVPHVAQQEIHKARGVRFRTVCTGRRFGKTMCLGAEILDRGGGECGGDYGWVAPTYNVAERGIEAFRQIGGDFVNIVGRTPSRVEFHGLVGLEPTRVWFLSADNAEAIRGYGFRGLVVDEAAVIPVDVWNYILRPTISQTMGWAIFVSTPKGRNWFYDMFTRGQDVTEKDYASFRFASKDSPFFPQAEWDEAKRTLPVDVFRQEYEAEFLEDSAGVFRGIDGCVLSGAPADDARNVVIGCDIAKHTDWTVLVAMDAETGRCFAMERFNQLEWPIQRERIVAFAQRHRGRVILDATGVGDPIYDDLKRVLPGIEPFVLTSASKIEVIQRLIVSIEQRAIGWPSGGEWETLTRELKRYEYEIGSSGRISYNAPSGFHDDCVMALALANHGRWECDGIGSMARIGSGGFGWRRRRVRPVESEGRGR